MKPKIVIAFSLYAFLAGSCGIWPNAPSQNDGTNIAIKGTFAGASKKTGVSMSKSAVSSQVLNSALDPSLVANVVVFNGINGFMISPVSNGKFNVSVKRNQPAALLFIDSAGKSLGYLSLGNGMESITLNMADTGVNSIDLQTLAASGDIVEPGHNPIGAEIPMSASDISSYVFSNGSLGSVIKSPDVDGDGIVDMSTGKFYRYTMRYDIKAGHFGTSLTPVVANPIVIRTYILEIKITDPDLDYPDTISFKGPSGSGIESATSWLTQSFGGPNNPSESRSYCAPPIGNPSIPPAGTYVVGYKTKTLTFNLLSQAEITKYLAIPVPTVILNSDSTIHKVTWEYRLSDGSATIDPKTLVSNIGIGIAVNGGPGEPMRYLTPGATEDVVTNQSIPWSSVSQLGTAYLDVFGNQIQVIWEKP